MVLRLFIAAALMAGCTASGDEVRPPSDEIFFPAGLALGPAAVAGDPEPALFVVNANSELRYDTGTVIAVDLAVADQLIAEWLALASSGDPADLPACPGCCTRDSRIPTAVVCDEPGLLVPGAVVRIGNFATDVAVQEFVDGAGGRTGSRLFIPVRGDPSVTWVDASIGGTLGCGGSGEVPICDDAHRLDQMRGDVALPALSGEPFSIYVDSGNGYAVLSHLVNGVITLIDTPNAVAEAPMISDAITGLFAADDAGQRSSVGVAGRTPGVEGDLIYVTASSENRVQILWVRRNPDGFASLVPADHFFLDRIFPSNNVRGIAFGAGGDRAYVANRDSIISLGTPSVQVIDTSIGDTGFPRNRVISAVEICREASVIAAADLGKGDRVYVSCFSDGEVWVVDPADGTLEAVVDVGRGPHKTALSVARRRLYVANFLEDTIAVLDVDPVSPTENRMVLKIGRERGEDQ